MAAMFPADLLLRFRDTREVRIETTSASGDVHRTIIWIVVDGDEVFARSHQGRTARWFRELTRTGDGAVVVGRDRIPVRAVVAADPESVTRCSRALREKYRRSASTPSMIRDDILDTTLRFEPA